MDVDINPPNPMLPELAAKYGVNKTQFWSIRSSDMFFLVMNTSRPLFKNNPELRQAVNFAVDRRALEDAAGGGDRRSVTDDYLPPGTPGYVDGHLYPLERPDLRKAQALARGHTRSGKATLILCDTVACPSQANIIRANLKQIGVDVEVKLFPYAHQSTVKATRGRPWDLTVERHEVGYMDPSQYIDVHARRAENPGNREHEPRVLQLDRYNRLIDQAGRLSGGARYDAYGRLAVESRRTPRPSQRSPFATSSFFVSSRVGCVQTTGAQWARPRRPLPQVDRTVTQTIPSSPTAIPSGLLPTRIVATTLLVRRIDP